MAVVGPTISYDFSQGGTNRLGGSLAASATISNGNSYRERLVIPSHATSIDVRLKMTVSGGTPTVQLVPQTANLTVPSLTVSSVTSGLTTATDLVTGTEAVHSYTPGGEQLVDVVLDATGASAAGTLTYCDVSVQVG